MSELEKRIRFLKNIISCRIIAMNPLHWVQGLMDCSLTDMVLIESLEKLRSR